MGACEPAQGQGHRRPGLATSLPCSVWVRERCSSFLLICGRPLVEEHLVPHLGSTVELALVAWVWVSCPEGVRVGEPFLPLLAGALGKIARPAQESWSCGMGSGDLNSTSTIQVQVQGLELAHPTPSMNCWSTWKTLSYRLGAAGSPWHKAAMGYLSEDPVCVVWQKSKALNWPVTHCNEYLQVKTFKQKGILVAHSDTLQLPWGDFVFNVLFSFKIVAFYFLLFVWGGRVQIQGVDTKRRGDQWDWGTWCESHKK